MTCLENWNMFGNAYKNMVVSHLTDALNGFIDRTSSAMIVTAYLPFVSGTVVEIMILFAFDANGAVSHESW